MEHKYNVEPRFTPGSPALVDSETARRVAAQEREAFDHALSGVWGARDKECAEQRGLDLIVFQMVEKRQGWEVHDLITGKDYFWPFAAQCPTCKTKKVLCKRGHLEIHQCRDARHPYTCSDRSFVGKQVIV